MNALYLVIIALAVGAIAYRYYAAFIAAKLVGPRDKLARKTRTRRFSLDRSNGSGPGSDLIIGDRWARPAERFVFRRTNG